MVFYPDNVNRRDRAFELQNDITSLQTTGKEMRAMLNKQDSRMKEYIELVMKRDGVDSFEELQVKLNSVLDGDQRKMLKDLFDNSSKVPHKHEIILRSITTIVMGASVASSSIKIVNFLRAANMCVVFRGLSEAFITLATDGLEAGIQAFKALSMTMRWAGESLEQASRVARYAANVGRFLKTLAIVGLFTDAFILAFDAYKEHEQKEALDAAIQKLYVSRIVAKVFARTCETVKTLSGFMLSYLIVTEDNPHEEAGSKLLDSFIESVDHSTKEITAKTSLDILVLLDVKRGSWTTDDPTYSEALREAGEFLDNSASS